MFEAPSRWNLGHRPRVKCSPSFRSLVAGGWLIGFPESRRHSGPRQIRYEAEYGLNHMTKGFSQSSKYWQKCDKTVILGVSGVFGWNTRHFGPSTTRKSRPSLGGRTSLDRVSGQVEITCFGEDEPNGIPNLEFILEVDDPSCELDWMASFDPLQ